MPDTRLILHVKGTEAETAELPKEVVRAAISEGKITHSQLIWIPADNAWKQVRELPDLLPSQKLAPSPTHSHGAAAPVHNGVGAIIPESPTGPVDRAAAAAGAPVMRMTARIVKPQTQAAADVGKPKAGGATPAGSRAAQAKDAAPASTAKSFVVKEESGFNPFKWLCIGLGILVLLGLGGNYLMVDRPLVSNLGQTSYSNVTVYAHFGAFMQPNVVVIHIPASTTITPDNVTDFLVALAHSTPQSPITGDLYERVALTSGWTAQYSFSGYSWKQLGDMENDSEAQRKEFVMAQMVDGSGQPLLPETTLNETLQQARRDQAWETFVAHFAAKR